MASVRAAVTAVAMPRPRSTAGADAGEFAGAHRRWRAGGPAGAATVGRADERDRPAVFLDAPQPGGAVRGGGELSAERLGKGGVE